MDWTVFKLLAWTEGYFKEHGIDSPRLAAEILLGFCLGIRRLDLYLQHDRPLEKGELARFKALIKRRKSREPVAYITGEKGFYESRFRVGPGVLIPRPDTETLVEQALALLASRPDHAGPAAVLELGVGSGAVITSLAKRHPGCFYVGCDISGQAISTARKNAGVADEASILFFRGSWLAPLRTHPFFDLILSNPPYISSSGLPGLAPEIREYEPVSALDGGPDGLDCIREIIVQARSHLKPGGVLLLEMGFDQKEGVGEFMRACPGYEPVEFVRDLAGHDRVVRLKKAID